MQTHIRIQTHIQTPVPTDADPDADTDTHKTILTITTRDARGGPRGRRRARLLRRPGALGVVQAGAGRAADCLPLPKTEGMLIINTHILLYIAKCIYTVV